MRILTLAALSLFAFGAFAEQPAVLLDHHTMIKQLRTNGVDPAFVGWAEIEPLCVGFMNYKDDPTEYNRCKRDKAVQQASWRTDRETCDIESLAVTPDSLRKQPRAIITEYKGGPDNDKLTTIETPKISRQELRISRAATYNRCMSEKGWQSPRDWRLGYAQ